MIYSKKKRKTSTNVQENNLPYDELVTEQKFKLYDEAERLGID